ncbi:hypothetical protein K1T71_012106 [Dendrolimus kikuchii]|uniref:Uncharacterized protein n=1 Tax=Dendrolimus kikuchii TaxID=765133 RepID=A0ACC1CKN3_9NEOP|nr:hypothetical protein K1T71_012106 [Dendrolimus kikuchii]
MLSENTPPLTFKERVEELWTVVRVLYIKLTYADKHEEELYNRFLVPEILKRRSRIPSFQEVKYSGSLVLGNTHVSVGQAIRLPQNYKHVGGYHIEGNVEPLPEGLKKIMDEAKNGVIYFSMGSNLNSKDMPEEMNINLLKMFGTLKQTIIWKFEEELPGRPKNVHIVKWAPQPSILAHPNCVLFITHGGLLSTTETVYFGVPIIGIPIFADQFTNVIRAVRRGIALRVDLSNAMADDLKIAIEEIVGNPKYTQTVKQLSKIFHDRQMTPGAELVYWVEHVIRTKGAPHLKSPALLLPWYQKAYLDLAIIILIILIVALLFIRKLLCLSFAMKIVDGIKKKN